MNRSDTIAAIASPPARSARAIIRLSGPDTLGVLSSCTDNAPRSRAVHTARLRLSEAHDLPVLLLVMPGPRTYTGQDSAEIQLPGNPHLAQRVHDLLIDAGARLAEPGEFTARAYLNGGLSLTQAEGVAQQIAAQTDAQLDAAIRLLSGQTGDTYRNWADDLASALALVEAGIDFTDQEDVVAIAPRDLDDRLARLIEQLQAHAGTARPSEARDDRATVAIVGPPNAGKSTLFNALLGRARAVVSDVRGTTRDVLAEPLDLSDVAPTVGRVTLLDLAGLDPDASCTIDGAAQRHALDAIASADLLLLCDPSGRFESSDLAHATPAVRVRTKADLPSSSSDEPGTLAVCALDGWNLGPLRRAIADGAASARSGEASTLLPRHQAAIRSALDALLDARGALDASLNERHIADPELVGGAMRTALDALAQLAGEVSPDDVIGRIFATFCVGK